MASNNNGNLLIKASAAGTANKLSTESGLHPVATSSRLKTVLHSLPYFLILAVFLLQIFAVVQTYSLTTRLTISDTLFLLILHFDKLVRLWTCFGNGQREGEKTKECSTVRVELFKPNHPFLVVLGCVTFEALIFVNLTHSLEAIFCHEPGARISPQFMAINGLNILAKLVFLVVLDVEGGCGKSRPRRMPIVKQLILHFLAPIVALALSVMSHHGDWVDNYFMVQLGRKFRVPIQFDPCLSIVLCVVLSLIVVPLFIDQIRYLLLHNPQGVDVEKFKREIEEKFPSTRCNHLHIFRHHPNQGFEVLMDIEFLEGNKTDEKEHHQMAQRVVREIGSVLHKAGASRVTIQPHFPRSEACESDIDDNMKMARKTRKWAKCLTRECTQQKSCCKIKD